MMSFCEFSHPLQMTSVIYVMCVTYCKHKEDTKKILLRKEMISFLQRFILLTFIPTRALASFYYTIHLQTSLQFLRSNHLNFPTRSNQEKNFHCILERNLDFCNCVNLQNYPHRRMKMTKSNSWNENDSEIARDDLNIWPLDEFNIELLNQVHPKEWKEDDVDEDTVFDLVVIGSGAGGLVSAKQAARRGVKRVAMISEHLAGGDCLNVGCVPSKAIIRCAKAVREVRRAREFGIVFDGIANNEFIRVDFGEVMSRMRKLRAKIAPIDSHQATEDTGARVFQGRATFTSPNTVSVNGKTLQFKKAIIATGGRASVPLIKGLKEAPYTTNAELFNLTKLPNHLVIIGSGVVALEMAQTFQSFGSRVTVLNRSAHLFPRTDPDVGRVLERALVCDGVKIMNNFKFEEVVTKNDNDETTLMVVKGSTTNADGENSSYELKCDVLLVAAGRTPNTDNLGLEEAGIKYDKGGIIVDDLLCSTNKNVYAVGDCVSGVPRLTHMSGEMAKVAVQNSIFNDSWKLSSLVVPATMYTEPEYASVGHTVIDDDTDAFTTSIEHNDRSILEGETHPGFVRIYCKKGTDTIVGAVIISSRAGEMISEIVLAMTQHIGLFQIGRAIHSYPTLGEAVMGAGLTYIRTKWDLVR